MKTTAAPKTELDLSKSYMGNCQCCFRQQVTKVTKSRKNGRMGDTNGLTMVLHGYNRPGVGHAVGDCGGYGQAPYELSCQCTKIWLGQLNLLLPRLKDRLAMLQAGPDSLLILVTDYSRSVPFGGKRPTRTIEIDRFTPMYEGRYGWEPDNGFDRHLKNKIGEVEQDIRHVEKDIEFLTKRVAEWKYAPEKLVEVKKDVPVVHAQNPVNGRRAWCSPRLRGANLATGASGPAEVTCTRCKARLEAR